MSNSLAAPPLGTADLERFTQVQQLTYQCAAEVAAELDVGITEREACARMRRWLRGNGVDDWFHIPFAWFGERTDFRAAPWTPLHFFPTGKRLTEGMPFILDIAPVKQGYVADIGYAGCLGENKIWQRLDTDLAGYRPFILERVRRRDKFADIYREVDARIAAQGYESRHKVYPGRVIGHQVSVINSRLPRRVAGAFGIRALQTLGREFVKERLEGASPLWAGNKASAHPPTPGIWAVEPHIGFRGVAVKFEELLVVTEDDAYWLDDDLPHVRRWARRGIAA